ncbi:MAG: lipid-A-disaccharide synthase [Dysgonamonadaceae bacterium]|jgi:lipid-A-disaccharide synthase|nr:lipid-A-disaccharide synthase [Dysgonamonadaceae bacterium]
MKYFLVVGEASGDLHASNLMKSLKMKDVEADFRFFGGGLMQQAGGKMLKHYREMAFMGFVPVLMNLDKVFKNLNDCKREIIDYQPDAVILVDYPGFNLKIAKFIKDNSLKFNKLPKIIYYISPKIWAWKEGRIKTIRQYVDKMLCIFPFEVDFYKKRNYSVEYVGNPTVDEVFEFKSKPCRFEDFISANNLDSRPIIALLAGSRKQEIKDNLPAMIEAASQYAENQLVIAGAPGISPEYYRNFTAGKPVKIVFNQTYELLRQSKAALVTSGTATLETALFGVPQAVCYKTPLKRVSTFVWKHFFGVKYISLVNLVADREVVKELFGVSFSVGIIKNELGRLLNDSGYRQKISEDYAETAALLGAPGASERAAASLIAALIAI